ncbi:MAG TPA: retropepsin-like aspartic protease [Candidatus Acidoferrum sp.]|nr:retropepsin-like aspartic protease [Candidatus Acidoferrum sp.]
MHRVFTGLVALFLSGSWTWGSSLAAMPPKNPPHHSGRSIPRGTIPVKVYRGFLVVAEGQFGGTSDRKNFIIDTGTSPSILSLGVARQLALPLSQAKLSAIGRQSEIYGATVPEIRLGPLHALSLPVLVTDLSSIERDLDLSIAGILGMDVLGKSSFRLDYGNQLIEFGEIVPVGIPVSLSTHADLPIAEIKVAGKLLHLVVDTGSERLVFFGARSAAAVSPNKADIPLRGASVAGALPVRGASSLNFELDGKRFHQDAYFVPASEEPLFDGLLSVRSLNIRVLSMDADRRIVYLSK